MLEKMIRERTAQQERQLETWMAAHDRAHPFPGGVCLTENVPYGDGGDGRRMDVFRPENGGEGLPVLVNIHGGGFLLGKKEANRLFCADLCLRGFVVFCVEYPLVPQTDVFGILRELSCAVDTVEERCAAYGGDPARICLCGDSAGAWLCVYLAASQRSASVAHAAGLTPPRPAIHALGLISGMFYTDRLDQIGLFLPAYIYGRGWRRHPFRRYMDPGCPDVAGNLPPAFLVTARGDFLERYSTRFAGALRKCGAEYELLDIRAEKKLPHAFAAMLPETPEAQRANAAMAAFLLEKSVRPNA